MFFGVSSFDFSVFFIVLSVNMNIDLNKSSTLSTSSILIPFSILDKAQKIRQKLDKILDALARPSSFLFLNISRKFRQYMDNLDHTQLRQNIEHICSLMLIGGDRSPTPEPSSFISPSQSRLSTLSRKF